MAWTPWLSGQRLCWVGAETWGGLAQCNVFALKGLTMTCPNPSSHDDCVSCSLSFPAQLCCLEQSLLGPFSVPTSFPSQCSQTTSHLLCAQICLTETSRDSALSRGVSVPAVSKEQVP